MVHIVVDLEMNEVSRKIRVTEGRCRAEVIEFGAVALDAEGNEIGSFMLLVKPEYADKIAKNIEKLTGITTEMVKNAPMFREAFKQFADWCNGFGDFTLYEWSDSDRSQLINEIEDKGICVDENMVKVLGNWCDLQYEYGQKLNLDRAISLKQAIDFSGADFQGRAHDALVDARNTAYLLNLYRDEEAFDRTFKPVLDVLKPKSIGSNLGAMFDFAGMLALD